jgi:excisionase family DNA binding protein
MSDREDPVVAEGWITTSEAVDLTGYGAEYLRQLARKGAIEARKFAGRWLFSRDDLLGYKARMDALGRKKHDPRGPEHAQEGT